MVLCQSLAAVPGAAVVGRNQDQEAVIAAHNCGLGSVCKGHAHVPLKKGGMAYIAQINAGRYGPALSSHGVCRHLIAHRTRRSHVEKTVDHPGRRIGSQWSRIRGKCIALRPAFRLGNNRQGIVAVGEGLYPTDLNRRNKRIRPNPN